MAVVGYRPCASCGAGPLWSSRWHQQRAGRRAERFLNEVARRNLCGALGDRFMGAP